jgi:hypothetical protein
MAAATASASRSGSGTWFFGKPASPPPWMLHPCARASALRAWLNTPAGGMALLILTTLLARLVFASALGLGIDESYMVAAGRTLRLGYFDHPPLAWWMAWAAAHIAGNESAIVVRLPFILLFALTTWLMFRLTASLFGACAGLWAAVLLNAAPVFGVTDGSWVLPDGPLIATLLGAVACLVAALPARGRAAWGWWLGTGLCAGLALFSKYSAVLSIIGAVAFLLTEPTARHWLLRPHPYAAGLLALAVFSPVLAWNAEHGWASLLFQAGRAGGGRLHPFGPLSTLAGEALFLLPWIWAPLMICGAAALRRGPRDSARWLLACLALPPILLFLVVSLRSHVLFHWASPGYLMLFPLLGDAVGRRWRNSRPLRVGLAATAAFVTIGAMFVASEVRFNWLPEVAEDFTLGTDPDLGAVDWTSVRTDLAARGLLGRPGLIVAATRWHDAGKIDYALDGQATVICLGTDPREYGLIARPDDYAGDDVLIVAPRDTLAQVTAQFGASFDSIKALPAALVRHDGRPAMVLPLFMGHRFHHP